MTEESTISRAKAIVESDVRACASYLVHTLASQYGLVTHIDASGRSTDLSDLIEQAFDLASPVLDYESAAIDAGWEVVKDPSGTTDYWIFRNRFAVEDSGLCDTPEEAYRLCCEHNSIEPYEREVFEHWIVSRWLGEKLAAKGEKVDFDFAGFVIWARTTTGQAIYMDYVIQQIAKDLAND